LIIKLVTQYRLPTVYPFHFFVTGGGLISYGPDALDPFWRRPATSIASSRVRKPADLPVQPPTKYELVINLKTANALGFTVPDTLLARRRGDRVVFAAARYAAFGRLCCKSRFVPVIKNSAGRRLGFRVRMWGTSSLHAKRTGGLGNAIKCTRIGDRFPSRFSRKIPSPATFNFCNSIGTKRRTAATRQLGRKQSEADIGRRRGRIASGADDPGCVKTQKLTKCEKCNSPIRMTFSAHTAGRNNRVRPVPTKSGPSA
jgi:hypothetical protein